MRIAELAFICAILIRDIPVVCAESFEFTGQTFPKPGGLDGWYIFRAYSGEDYAAMSGKAAVPPVAEFEVQAKSPDDSGKGYTSLEATIMYFAEFEEKLKPNNLCKDGKFSQDMEIKEQASFPVPVVTGGDGSQEATLKQQVMLNNTGRYIMFVTNCGSLEQAQQFVAVGEVKVKNAYGYLPPEEYHKLWPLCILTFLYVVAVGIWMCYSIRDLSQFYDLHYWMSGLAMLCIAELITKVYALEVWNSADQAEPWLSIATTFFVMKWVCLYTLAVNVCTNRYDTDEPLPQEEAETSGGCWACSFFVASLYAGLLSLREFIRQQRDGLNIVTSLVLTFDLPIIILDVVMAITLVVQAQKQYAVAEKSVDVTKSMLFARLHRLCVFCCFMSVAALTVEMSDELKILDLGWQRRWLPREGASHLVSLIAVLGGMVVLRPGMVIKSNPYGKVAPLDRFTDDDLDGMQPE
eukprot:CAMPEP_0178380212 /NCGR_PEP_ID=MMETSP0689_2-20121128/5344_1 /TAXON_ID=160604 /ORGANISM="Amphidinium massartii, Strain CS-259" /LENGTH=463 /DNA_ID=CAMNT_0020000343 /DNA_START=82 /DNA_END=1470 /DNA_ORIENTATION=+